MGYNGAWFAGWTPRSGVYDRAKWVNSFVISSHKLSPRSGVNAGGGCVNELPSDTRAVRLFRTALVGAIGVPSDGTVDTAMDHRSIVEPVHPLPTGTESS